MGSLCGSKLTGTFNNVDPASQQRMDLVVFDPGHPNSLYDAVVTHPVSAEVTRSNKVNLQATQKMQRTNEKH